MDHFIDLIEKGRPKRIENEDGIRSQIIIDAAYEAARRNRKIILSETEEDETLELGPRRVV
jgi:predicted dehydrogenase